MTEVCATSSVSVNEILYKWKINNFGVMFNAAGQRGISSPEFNIGYNKCWLHISPSKLNTFINFTNNITNECHNVYIYVELAEEGMIFGGSIIIEMEGSKLSGMFGDPTGVRPQEIFEKTTTSFFLNQTPSMVFQTPSVDKLLFTISPKHLKPVEITAKLFVPSSITNTINQEPAKNTGLAKLSADMRTMLNKSDQCYDCSIKCGGEKLPCHEFVLRARSAVMETMLDTKMKETNMRSMTIVDVGPNTMAAALEYMYTGEITMAVENIPELIYFADKYNMEGLLEFCFQKLPEVEDHMVVDFLFMADKHNLVEYKKEAMVRINMKKSKYLKDQRFMKKLQEVPHLLMELYQL